MSPSSFVGMIAQSSHYCSKAKPVFGVGYPISIDLLIGFLPEYQGVYVCFLDAVSHNLTPVGGFMQTNETSHCDQSDNPAECCLRFKPKGWDDQWLHVANRFFVPEKSRSLMHISINMGPVFDRAFGVIMQSQAHDDEHAMLLSRDLPAWFVEHLLAVTKHVPGPKKVQLKCKFAAKTMPSWSPRLNHEMPAFPKALV
ncbi:hypothetical protein A8B75_13550 [Sphingomonadales bacterium EhC05]|nr:hypothetical protein A8B75_13550 [Sphingomonadales bacterium EhC05]